MRRFGEWVVQRPQMTGLIVVGLLTGCAVQVPQPDAATMNPQATRWEASKPVVDPQRVVALQDWWAGWHDAVLQRLQVAAQQSSPSLQQATARIQEARADAAAAGAALWPRLTLHGADTHSRNEVQQPNERLHTQSLGLDASWELDLFGGVAAARQSYLATQSARDAEWHDARISLAAEVANAYVMLRSLEQQIQLQQEQQRSLQQTRLLVEKRRQAGWSSATDVLNLDAALANGQSQLQELQSARDLTIKGLVALTGVAERDIRDWVAVGYAGQPQPPELVVDDVPANVLQQRPDIRIAADGIRSAASAVGVAEALRYPSVSLLGSISRLRVGSAGATIEGNSWSFGPSISFPLFDGGRLKAQQEAAEARYQQSVAAYQGLVRQAVREVEEALVRLEGSRIREQQLRQAVSAYQQVYRNTDILWKAGSVSQLELEEARRQWRGAEMALAQLQRERVSYWIALYKATGGDWTHMRQQPR